MRLSSFMNEQEAEEIYAAYHAVFDDYGMIMGGLRYVVVMPVFTSLNLGRNTLQVMLVMKIQVELISKSGKMNMIGFGEPLFLVAFGGYSSATFCVFTTG